MSYDLMVFDPAAPPRDRAGFLAWFAEQAKWAEGHDYQDPAVTTPALRAWFMAMLARFPALNGPHAPELDDDDDEGTPADYSIGRRAIYACFGWPSAAEAREEVFRLASAHGVGFFDVSADDGEVWLPSAPGRLTRAHGAGSSA